LLSQTDQRETGRVKARLVLEAEQWVAARKGLERVLGSSFTHAYSDGGMDQDNKVGLL
jgi:hypothetical protein